MWKLVFQYIQFGFSFGIEFYFFKKISGNMLVSFVSASVVWFCFSEYKIKHTKKNKQKKKIRTWKLVFQYGLFLPFGIENFYKKKNCGNMFFSLVSTSLVWSCLLEYKINQNKKRSERGNWPSSLVWLCLLEQKKKNVEICWSLQFMLIQFGLAFWNRKLTKKKRKRLECGNWSSSIYSLDLPFGIEFSF